MRWKDRERTQRNGMRQNKRVVCTSVDWLLNTELMWRSWFCSSRQNAFALVNYPWSKLHPGKRYTTEDFVSDSEGSNSRPQILRWRLVRQRKKGDRWSFYDVYMVSPPQVLKENPHWWKPMGFCVLLELGKKSRRFQFPRLILNGIYGFCTLRGPFDTFFQFCFRFSCKILGCIPLLDCP